MDVIYIPNPYPLPDVVSEGEWLRRPVLGDKVVPDSKDWKSKVNACERLFAHHTLNSIRKDARLLRTQAPNDSLDFSLATVYVHSKDLLVPKCYVPMQPETLGRKTWRVLRNKIAISNLAENSKEISKDPLLLFLKKSECQGGPEPTRRVHPCSVKLNISGPHAVQSNPGYSRKIDGTFFSI